MNMTRKLWENTKASVVDAVSQEHKTHYRKLHHEYLLAEDVHEAGYIGSETEPSQNIIASIRKGDWEPNDASLSEKFYKSLHHSKRAAFLSPYSVDDFSHMKLFLVRGENAGFALKDSDIVSVHNNTGTRGVGAELLKQAIKNGGNMLDHFDGFLHGYYAKFGFKTYNRDLWNDKYAPANWTYAPINIFDPEYSSYAKDLQPYLKEFRPEIVNSFTTIKPSIIVKFIPTGLSHELVRVLENYRFGKPSIIYQKL